MQEAPCCDFDLCALSNILLYFGCWMFFCSAGETLRSVKNRVSCCVFQTMEASGRKGICASAPLTVLWEEWLSSGNPEVWGCEKGPGICTMSILAL